MHKFYGKSTQRTTVFGKKSKVFLSIANLNKINSTIFAMELLCLRKCIDNSYTHVEILEESFIARNYKTRGILETLKKSVVGYSQMMR